MFSRRSFVWASSAAAAVALGANKSAVAQSTKGSSALPASIAALPSFAGKVPPFTNEERLARIDRAKRLMTEDKIDAIVLSNTTASTEYFADIKFGGSERMWALVIPAKAKPFIVCPHFEDARAHELLRGGPFANDADILTWEENQSPFTVLAGGLKDRGISAGRVGLDENMKFVFAESLEKAAPQVHFVSAIPVTAGCRMIKEPHEIECIRVAGHATLAVYKAVYEALKDGMTTADVHNLVAMAYGKVGLKGEASLNIGEYTASPHGSRMPQTITEGTPLMLDDGCVIEGYTSDITRTFVLGTPSDKMKQVFQIVHRAQQAGLKAAKPGVVAGSVDLAARKVIVDAGYGPGYKYFSHRLGHGIGLDMHEWPYLSENDMFGWDLNPTLKPNMIFSDEPGIYIPGEFGIRLEDDMLITEDGAELLTPPSPSLDDPFGKA